jgi:hypothetical protein
MTMNYVIRHAHLHLRDASIGQSDKDSSSLGKTSIPGRQLPLRGSRLATQPGLPEKDLAINAPQRHLVRLARLCAYSRLGTGDLYTSLDWDISNSNPMIPPRIDYTGLSHDERVSIRVSVLARLYLP